MPTSRTVFATVVLAAAFLAAAAAGPSQQAPAGAAPPAVEPTVLQALERMGAYLRTLDSFEVQARTAIDEVLESGQKLQFDGAIRLRARRPDRLWAEVVSDRKTREYFYDGKTFTIYGPRNKLYASVPAPATLREMITAVEEKYGIFLPLADLFRWGTDPLRRETLRAAINVGPATVGGTPCDHLAFRDEGIDWQVWIQKGDAPLPRKLVITTTDDEARPQYVAALDWNLAPALNDRMFTFEPPQGASRIAIREVTLEPASGNSGGN
ncbi:MAG TPA: DUF2092 domain-containing protein [Thermoanaerobaculia bacterium]